MMSIKTSRIHKIDVGTPPSSSTTSDCSGWEIIQVQYHGFTNLTTTRNKAVLSPEFTCFGHNWRVQVYPGGRASSDDGMVCISLRNLSNNSIALQYGFSINNECYKLNKFFISPKEGREFAPFGTEFDAGNQISDCWGPHNFAKRSEIIGALEDGTLIIEVRMRKFGETAPALPFIPENPLVKNILSMFMNEESSDILFEVEEAAETGDKSRKRSRTSTPFYAHRFILQQGSSMLAEMCKSGGKSNAFSITDVSPEIFRHMLYHIYGGKLDDDVLKNNAKNIIEAADKYGLVNLKLEAEASLVTSTKITLDNMMDNLLYAASKNCALLQESVLDFAVENSDDVSEKVSFDDVPGSVVADLFAAVSRNKNKVGVGDGLSTMRVSELRKKLHEKGLDVDGSRKAMIATLKKHQES